MFVLILQLHFFSSDIIVIKFNVLARFSGFDIQKRPSDTQFIKIE